MMNNNMELNLDELKTVSGGDSLRDHPLYNQIKALYVEKGVRTASAACDHYLGGKISMEMIKLIKEEVEDGAGQMAENNASF